MTFQMYHENIRSSLEWTQNYLKKVGKIMKKALFDFTYRTSDFHIFKIYPPITKI